MADILLKDDYRLANCCNPQPGDSLTGFLKYDSQLISVHKKSCGNLAKIEPDPTDAERFEVIKGA